jgi:hypothetical protein
MHGAPHRVPVVGRVEGAGAGGEPDAHEVPGGGIDARGERAEAHVRSGVAHLEVGRHLSFGALQLTKVLQRAHEPRRDHLVAEQEAGDAGHHRVAGKDGAVVGGRRTRGVDAVRAAQVAQQRHRLGIQ